MCKEILSSVKYIDSPFARSLLPKRHRDANKGSFGKLLMITGSERYRGAAHLSLEAALRGGVGIVSFVGSSELCAELRMKLPEVIYNPLGDASDYDTDRVNKIVSLSHSHSAILVGSGSGRSEGLFMLLSSLLKTDGVPLVLDADALNVLAERGSVGLSLLKKAVRKIIITPHPLEFSRLCGLSVDEIQGNRADSAVNFAREYGVTVVLKGAGTVVTDGEQIYVNTTGSTALSKGGSGDVLAGLLSSLLASGAQLLDAAIAAVYYHGLAADRLALELSEYGVTPSDLPKAIAREIATR